MSASQRRFKEISIQVFQASCLNGLTFVQDKLRAIADLFFIWFIVINILGCSNVSKQPTANVGNQIHRQTQNDTTLNPNEFTDLSEFRIYDSSGGVSFYQLGEFSLNSKNSPGEVVSSLYFVEGKVSNMNQTATVLNSITIQFVKALPTAKGTSTPFKNGQSIVIHFNEPLSRLRIIHLKTGSEVRLIFAQFELRTNHQELWGSNVSWFSVEKDGAFYGANGEKVSEMSK
jgi:hypothetical protein